MRILIAAVASVVMSGCALMGPHAENTSGLEVAIKSVKNHSEGVDVAVKLHNTTHAPMKIYPEKSVVLLLNGQYPVKGRVSELVDILPGKSESAKLHFVFMNEPKVYKNALLEITPKKAFKSCSQAEKDPDVVHESREVAGAPAKTEDEIEADSCDRALKRVIRVAVPD